MSAASHPNTFPKLHNAAWPGVVGKGEGSEPAIGLDTMLSIAEVLHRELGDDKYRPPTLLRNLVAAGWHGRKVGRGFYQYDANGQKTNRAL